MRQNSLYQGKNIQVLGDNYGASKEKLRRDTEFKLQQAKKKKKKKNFFSANIQIAITKCKQSDASKRVMAQKLGTKPANTQAYDAKKNILIHKGFNLLLLFSSLPSLPFEFTAYWHFSIAFHSLRVLFFRSSGHSNTFSICIYRTTFNIDIAKMQSLKT